MSKWADLTGPVPSSHAVIRGLPQTNTRSDGLAYQRVYEWRSYPAEAPIVQYREDASDPESPIVEEPARWWQARSVGFRAKLLVNPLGGELRRQVRAHIAYLRGESGEDDYLKSLADRVVAWDYAIVDDAGERHPVAPPCDGEDGWERFYDLPFDVMNWLTDEIENAHLPKKATTRSSKNAGASGSPIPTTTDRTEADAPAS